MQENDGLKSSFLQSPSKVLNEATHYLRSQTLRIQNKNNLYFKKKQESCCKCIKMLVLQENERKHYHYRMQITHIICNLREEVCYCLRLLLL